MAEEKKCSCQGDKKLIFSCSGAADVGEIADQASRKLKAQGIGSMLCIAAIGARLENYIKMTASASDILAIDGCDQECAKKTLELVGFNQFKHLRVIDMGMEKGASPATEENVNQVANKGKTLLVKCVTV